MKRRSFLTAAVAAMVPLKFWAQPTKEQGAIFGIATGVAFTQYAAKLNPANGGYVDDDADATVYLDWYSVLMPSTDAARAAFDDWAAWMSETGNRYKEATREKFPIPIYDATEYDNVRPARRDDGTFDMRGSWSLQGEVGKPYIGHLSMFQTGALVCIDWLHSDNPNKVRFPKLAQDIDNAQFDRIRLQPPMWGDGATEESIRALLPEPESFIFDPAAILGVAIERDWVQIIKH
jgi:hypothetical protein